MWSTEEDFHKNKEKIKPPDNTVTLFRRKLQLIMYIHIHGLLYADESLPGQGGVTLPLSLPPLTPRSDGSQRVWVSLLYQY